MQRTLTITESKVILQLEWKNIDYLVLNDIANILDCSPFYARRIASNLVEKGWLERIRPGKFKLISIREGKKPLRATNPYIFVRYLKEPYYISYYRALTHYGLMPVQNNSIHIVVKRQKHSVNVRNTNIHFIKAPAHKFFGWDTIYKDGEKIRIANLEKAVIDSVDRPELSGGIDNVIKMMAKSSGKINISKIDSYVKKMDSGILARRLGFICNLLRIKFPEKTNQYLLNTVTPNKVFLGNPHIWGTKGIVNEKWNLVQNISFNILNRTKEKRRC